MDASQFNLIYKEYYPKIIRICMGYAQGDNQSAQDLTQEVFIKIWQNIKTFREESKMSTWIYRIAVNTCLMDLRKTKKVRIYQSEGVSRQDHIDNESEIKELKFQKMYSCINKLSPENKAIVLLELEGQPQEEIAEIIGISHEAIRVRIHRIKKQLTKCVNNENI